MSPATSPDTPTDIVIIGGGIVGVCAAYYLSRHQRFPSAYDAADEAKKGGRLTVTLVEESEIAAAASGKAAGFLAESWHGPRTASLGQLSYALHTQLAAEHDGRARWGFREVRSVSVRAVARSDPFSSSSSPSQGDEEDLVDGGKPNPVLAEYEFRPKPSRRGEGEIDWLDERSLLGGRSSVNDIGGPEDTAQVHPKLFTRSLWEMAETSGVRLIKGRAAYAVFDDEKESGGNGEEKKGKLTGVVVVEKQRTGEGAEHTLPATHLLVTAGPWTGGVLGSLFPTSIYSSSTTHRALSQLSKACTYLPGSSILIRPTRALSAHAVFADILTPRSSNNGNDAGHGLTPSPEIFSRPDGEVYVAGDNEAGPLPRNAEEVGVDEEGCERLERAARLLSVEMGKGEVVKKQLCYRPFTVDSAPVVGKVPGLFDGLYVATGHGPWGITLAPGTGKVLAELILDGKSTSADISKLDPKRFVSF